MGRGKKKNYVIKLCLKIDKKKKFVGLFKFLTVSLLSTKEKKN